MHSERFTLPNRQGDLDTSHAFVFRVYMKTITLSEEAYQRLKSWKTEPSESFSKVVLKAVPKRGTAGDMNKAFEHLPELSRQQAASIEAEAEWANSWRNCPDPWATLPADGGPATSAQSVVPTDVS